MPFLETPDELADHIADLLGIYEDPRCGAIDGCWCTADADAGLHCHLDDEPGFPPHISGCNCRVEWAPRMAARIRRAVENETKLCGKDADTTEAAPPVASTQAEGRL